MSEERIWVLPPEQDGRPIEGPGRFRFSLSQLVPCHLSGWPRSEALALGWDDAVIEFRRHWPALLNKPLWTPYPTLSYCVAFAQGAACRPTLAPEIKSIIRSNLGPEAPDDMVSVSCFLFPVPQPKDQTQALAKLLCQTTLGSRPGNVRVWVDALADNELSQGNVQDIAAAMRILGPDAMPR